MAKILGITVTDQQARDYNTRDINGRIQILQFIGRGDLVDQAVQEWAGQNYGYLGGALKDKEVKALLTRAGREGWSEARIQAALIKTKYWTTHTANQRNWEQLKQTDPKTAKELVANAQANVGAIAARLGVSLKSGRAKSLAENIAKNGITDPAVIQRMVAGEAQFTGNLGPGDIQANVSAIKARGSEFGVLFSDRVAFDWAQRLAAGTATQDGIDEYLRQQAQARYASNKMIQDGLARGQTVREILDPQIAQVADLLEIDPDAIRLTDPRWSPILEKPDEDTMRPMTSAEAAQYARSQPEWEKTRNAQATSAGFGEKLLQTFGAVG